MHNDKPARAICTIHTSGMLALTFPATSPQGVPATQATPGLARQVAAAHSSRCRTLQRASQVAPLLRFVLSDLDLSSPAGVAALCGVPLLPLADGTSLVAATPLDTGGSRVGGAGGPSCIYVVSDELELLVVGSQGAWAFGAAAWQLARSREPAVPAV